jgi:hypothetical protein
VRAQKPDPPDPHHLTIEQRVKGGIADLHPAALFEDTARDYFEPDRPNNHYGEQNQHEYCKRNDSLEHVSQLRTIFLRDNAGLIGGAVVTTAARRD